MVYETGKWRRILPAYDRRQYERGGFGRRVAPGGHPALVVVDMTRLMFDPEFSLAPENGSFDVVERCAELVEYGRSKSWDIIWTRRSDRRLAAHRGAGDWKAAGNQDAGAEDFVNPLMPTSDELVIEKPKPSAFFETPLRSQLTFLGVDTLVFCGMATSGCVRATVLDAFSCNFRCFLVEEATGDRSPFSHETNLLDIDMKLASVVTLAELELLFGD